MSKIVVLAFTLFMLICYTSFGQLSSKTAQPDSNLDSLINLKLKQASFFNLTNLYNGMLPEPFINAKTNNENRYLIHPGWHLGSLKYDGLIFHHALLRYDIFNDKVSVRVNNEELRLIEVHVEWFQIENRKFVWLESRFDKNLSVGFYEIIIEEPDYVVYKKHRRKITPSPISPALLVYSNDDILVLVRENQIRIIKSINDLLPKAKQKRTNKSNRN